MARLQKAVRIDIDLEARRAAEAHAAEPVAQHRLQIDRALGLDEKPPAVAPPQDRERGGGGTQHADAGELRRGAAERAGRKIGRLRGPRR